MRQCSKCGMWKPKTAFYRDKRRKDGLQIRCKSCRNADMAEWVKRNPEWGKKWYQKVKLKTRERHLKRKYGVSLYDYAAMLAAQDGKCAICRCRPGKRAFDVDHDHLTKRVRGLLCTSCNRMLGHAGDDPGRLRAGADYLSAVIPR